MRRCVLVVGIVLVAGGSALLWMSGRGRDEAAEEGREGEFNVGAGDEGTGRLPGTEVAEVGESTRSRSADREKRAWRQPATRIELLEQETFEETLGMMGDWESNRYFLSGDLDALTGPSSLRMTIYCRRFAKLMEETEGGLSANQVEAILNRLEIDLAQWGGLSASGQSLAAEVVTTGGGELNHSDLIVPLTTQINATILLIGERSVEEALPLVLEAVDTIGADTCWAVVGYACDKIMTSMADRQMTTAQRQVVEEYLEWKEGLENKSFSEYTVGGLDPFRTTEWRWYVGDEGEIQVELPPYYNVLYGWPDGNVNAEPVQMDSSGNNRIAQRIVEDARRISGAINPGESP